MNRRIFGIAFGSTVAALTVVACASTRSGNDHETHWVTCKTASDCAAGYVCTGQRCEPETMVVVDGGQQPDGVDGGGCGPGVLIVNPTGNCSAPDNGGRKGYQTPGCDVWLPDCQNTLSREYWRVFATSRTTAYIVPRPDGSPDLMLPCNDTAHPLHALVEKYRFCHQSTSEADTNVMNNMLPVEALQIAHYLHSVLFFEPVEGVPGLYLRPFAIPTDVLDACALHPERITPELQQDCDLERQVVEGADLIPDFSDTAGPIADLLNELYGVGRCTAPELPGRVCTGCGPTGGCGRTEITCTRRCTQSSDCADASAGTMCRLGICNPPIFCL